jgi:hypothetical protein
MKNIYYLVQDIKIHNKLHFVVAYIYGNKAVNNTHNSFYNDVVNVRLYIFIHDLLNSNYFYLFKNNYLQQYKDNI